MLRVHSGPIANRLHITTFGRRQTVALQPHVREEVAVPRDRETLFTLEMAAEQAFTPRDRDPSSNDTRPLGVWVEVVR